MSSDAGITLVVRFGLEGKNCDGPNDDLVWEDFGAKFYSATNEIESNNSEPNLYLQHCRRNTRLINGHPKKNKTKNNNSKSYAAFNHLFFSNASVMRRQNIQ